jgi:hypothetical protein
MWVSRELRAVAAIGPLTLLLLPAPRRRAAAPTPPHQLPARVMLQNVSMCCVSVDSVTVGQQAAPGRCAPAAADGPSPRLSLCLLALCLFG